MIASVPEGVSSRVGPDNYILAQIESQTATQNEVGAFYWTVPAPDIVNLGREEQGSDSV